MNTEGEYALDSLNKYVQKYLRLRTLGIVIGVVFCLSMVSIQQVHANVILWENGSFADSLGGYSMGTVLPADDFLLTSPQSLSSFRIFVTTANNPFDEYFNGTIGWGIYTNIFGRPDELLYSGSDSSLTLTPKNPRVVQVDGDFDIPDLTLQPGRYWFAAKEGAWGEASDGTNVFWRNDGTVRIDYDARVDNNEANPGVWHGSHTRALVFSLYGPSIIPEPSSMALLLLTTMTCLRRKRNSQ